jgi:chromosome segregation ATPase
MSLQKQFQEVKSAQLLENDRTKEEVQKLNDLIEVTSADRDKARQELCESQERVQQLTKSNTEAQQEINHLKEEVQRQVVEIETLNEARKCSAVYEEKSKTEINRLRHKLDETTTDILRSMQNSTPLTQDGSTTDLHNNNNMLELPSLVDDVNIPSAEKVQKEGDVKDKDENAELSKMECTSLRAVIARLNRERDALRRMVDTLKPLATDSDIIQLGAMENEIEDLKTKLFLAEEAYCKIEVERDALLSETKRIGDQDSSLDTKTKEGCMVETDALDSEAKRIGDLESLLDAKVKENELLSAELKTMRAKTTDKVESLQEVNAKTNERLRLELAALRDVAINTDTDAAMQMSKEIEELKQEHRIEVKLLKQEHAEIKTSVKLLQKEKDEIATAYEQEKLSNVDLESSLQDLVTLFEQERAMHEEKIQAHKIVKKKYISIRKKRVPIDAAYKACRLTLDRLEGSIHDLTISKSQEPRSQSAQDATKLIELLDILNHELDGQSGSKLSSPSTYECFSSDRNLVEELAFRGKCLELKVLEMKVKVKMDHLTTLPEQSLESELTSPESFEALYAAHQALQEKSRNLTKELVDSTKAFEETISSYESVISKVKGLLAAKKDENMILKCELEKVKQMAHDKSANTPIMEAHHEELNAYREAVDVLKGRLEEEADAKAKLHMEVERLKSDFAGVISQFEQELLLSNEDSNKALQRIREERDIANLALSAKEEEYDQLASELEAVQEAISKLDKNGSVASQQATEYEQTIQSLQTKLAENESEMQKLMTTFDQLKESKQMQVQLLQNKLDDVMASNSEEVQLYEQLRADCTSLKEEKELALEKNAELTATIANITEENGALIAQNEMQRQSLESIGNELENARQHEARQLDSSRHELEEAQSQIESLIVENKSLLVKNEEQCHQLEILRTVKSEKETLAAKNDEQKHSLEIIRAQLESIRQDVNASKESADDKIASLIEERESLKVTNEKQKQSLSLIENQLATTRLKVSEADKSQKMATEKTTKLEARISSLQEEIKLAETAKNEAIIAADAKQDELTKASKRIEEMTVYTQTMKAGHEKKELELKNDIDSQMVCMNEVVGSLQRQIQSIELEKETNKKKYKHEIELQQKVSILH